jgi:prepilin-type N-terminal cleavage/methylation domain-containing protein/prepilin-type processing-associated H-X9-DG protein
MGASVFASLNGSRHIARETTPRENKRKHLAFTLVELLIVISIITVLIALLLPALSRARAQAQCAQCLSNLRQIGIAATLYSQQYGNSTLPCQFWIDGADQSDGKYGINSFDDWWTALVALKLLPTPASLTAPAGKFSNSTFDASSQSLLVCPTTPLEIGSGASLSNGHWPPVGNEGFDAHNYSSYTQVAAPSYVLAPAGAFGDTTPVWAVACSYGINADASYCQNGPMAKANNSALGAASIGQYCASPITCVGSEYIAPRKMNMIKHPSDLAFIYDGLGVGFQVAPSANLMWRIASRHGKPNEDNYWDAMTTGITNLLFFDGHVESLPRKQLPYYSDDTNTHSLGLFMIYQNAWNPVSLSSYETQAQQGGFAWPYWRVDQ